MSVNQVAIIVQENEQAIKELAQNMHIWVAATKKNKVTVKDLWKLELPEEYELSLYDVPESSTAEEMCLLAIDLVEDHHSSMFGTELWLEIQVHGCDLTQELEFEFKQFGNITLSKQNYGFNVTRTGE